MFNMVRFICVCLVLSAVGSASAQFKSTKLDEVTGEVNGVSIVINKRNPKNMLAASGDNLYITFDEGATWSKSKLNSPQGFFGSSVLLSNDKGHIFSFHSIDPTGAGLSNEACLSQIVCQSSEDGGKTWDSNLVEGNPQKDHWSPAATLDSKDNLYLTWIQFDKYASNDPNCLSMVLFSKSSGGKKWSKPRVLSQTHGTCLDDKNAARGSVPVSSLPGKIFSAWTTRNTIFLDRSFDGGDLWLSNDLAIEELSSECTTCGLPVLVGDMSKSLYTGSLYLVWSDQQKNSNDMNVLFKRSVNLGDNWTSSMVISGDEIGIARFKPQISVDKATGHIYVVYYSRRADTNETDIYIAYSIDSGSKFANKKISESSFITDDASLKNISCNISAHKGIITATWTGTKDGKISLWASTLKHEELIK